MYLTLLSLFVISLNGFFPIFISLLFFLVGDKMLGLFYGLVVYW